MSRPPYRPFGRDAAPPRTPARDPTAPPAASKPGAAASAAVVPVVTAFKSPAPVPDTRVLGQLSALRAERVYQEAAVCPDCAAARAESGQSDALCDHHMGDALGLHAQWGLQGPGKKF